jgi:hypothetical protein
MPRGPHVRGPRYEKTNVLSGNCRLWLEQEELKKE